MNFNETINLMMDVPTSRYVEEMWPLNVEEIFDIAKGHGYFHIEDVSMDNVESMLVFLQSVPETNIQLYDGTQVILSHPLYNFDIIVDSGGAGDMNIHVFELTRINK